MKIYTRTGDDMTTSLIYKRVFKNDEAVECLGTIDELSSHLMLATHYAEGEVKKTLISLAEDLFDLSADLLRAKPDRLITEKKIAWLENTIDIFSANLPEQHGFVLPGGTVASAEIHVARTVARRLERRLVTFGLKETLEPELFRYVNRLSDLLYVLARNSE